MSDYNEREQFKMIAGQMRVLHKYLRKATVQSGQPVDELDKVLEDLDDMPIFGSRRESYEVRYVML